jgi:hypothetical protein
LKVVLSAPMGAIEALNFPALDRARDVLVAEGYDVVSPADVSRAEGWVTEVDWGANTVQVTTSPTFNWHVAIARCLAEIEAADGIVQLPGWTNSPGCVIEHQHARRHGKKVFGLYANTLFEYDDQDNLVACRTLGGVCEPTAYTPGLDCDDDLEDDEDEVDEAVVASLRKLFASVDNFWASEQQPAPTGEVRITDPVTGGQKGSKPARFDLVPADTLWALAEHYGKGAAKYAERNWERGYAWGLTIAAAERHLAKFRMGEDYDEDGNLHVIAYLWHAMALATFALRGIGTDDRGVKG